SELDRRSEPRLGELVTAVLDRFAEAVSAVAAGQGYALGFQVNRPEALRSLCRFLFWEKGCSFGGIIAEEHPNHWQLHYPFLLPGSGWIAVDLRLPADAITVPSISAEVHAADWHEREIEDLFGLNFEGHPRLGDFILHDQVWHEGVAPHRKPHRKAVDAQQAQLRHRPNPDWQPLLVVKDP